jgi:Icc-related predicted phosphoesterase
MKLLVIGDFHGKFSTKLKNRVLKEKPDLIISLGDYFPFGYRKIWFKHCYKNQTSLWEIIGKKKFKELELKDIKAGEKLLKKFDALPFKIISVTGNIDRTKWKEAHKMYDKKIAGTWKWEEQDFLKPIAKKLKNIKFFDFSFAKFKDLIFIGYARSTFPGHVRSKEYRRQRIKLERLFNKFKEENKKHKVIFVSHNVPYNTKLDVIRAKDAHKEAKGKHYGSKLTRRLINKYQPFLVLAGHMHENQGQCKIKKSLIVNPGSADENKMALIELGENKKPKVRFIK